MPLAPDETALIKAGFEAALAPYKELVLRAFGPLVDQIADMLGDYGRQYRFKQLAKILPKMQRMADEAGIDIKVIPPRILLPAVHFASLEDDEALQEKWAALLANASAVSDRIPASFPDILHSLSPAEVRFLDAAFDSGIPIEEGAPNADQVMLDDLQRLGLLRVIPGSRIMVNREPIGNPRDTYVISALGKTFIGTCRPPRPAHA